MTARLILTGPLAWPPLLARLAGEGLAAAGRRAALSDVAIADTDACFPPAVLAPGGLAPALLIDAPAPEIFARLSYLAAAIGMVPVPRHVGQSGADGAALAFLDPTPGAVGQVPWNMAVWADRWGDIALSAADEIIGYLGRVPAGDLGWRMPMILARAASRQAARHAAPATLRSETGTESVEMLARDTPHAGFFLTRAYDLRPPAFGGGIGEEVRREVFVATDAALVLPYDPARDRVLVVEQFRMGPYGRGDPRPFVLEPVAGRVDAGETPEAAARRECLEEAGLTLAGLEHITSHYCSPGCSTEFYHCYLGLADLPVLERGSGGLASEHEDIRTHVVTFDAAMALMDSGEANIGPLVLMLLWLQRERARLRAAA